MEEGGGGWRGVEPPRPHSRLYAGGDVREVDACLGRNVGGGALVIARDHPHADTLTRELHHNGPCIWLERIRHSDCAAQHTQLDRSSHVHRLSTRRLVRRPRLICRLACDGDEDDCVTRMLEIGHLRLLLRMQGKLMLLHP